MKNSPLAPHFRDRASAAADAPERHVPATLTIRLRADQRKALRDAAGDLGFGPFIRSQLFDDDGKLRPSKRTKRLSDPEALARALTLLGDTRMVSSLSQLARASNSGSLDLSPEAYEELSQACSQVGEIRALIVKALGLRERS